jgi:hypothetical protein
MVRPHLSFVDFRRWIHSFFCFFCCFLHCSFYFWLCNLLIHLRLITVPLNFFVDTPFTPGLRHCRCCLSLLQGHRRCTRRHCSGSTNGPASHCICEHISGTELAAPPALHVRLWFARIMSPHIDAIWQSNGLSEMMRVGLTSRSRVHRQCIAVSLAAATGGCNPRFWWPCRIYTHTPTSCIHFWIASSRLSFSVGWVVQAVWLCVSSNQASFCLRGRDLASHTITPFAGAGYEVLAETSNGKRR